VQTHTIRSMQIDKNRHNRTTDSEVGGRKTRLHFLNTTVR